jgi:tetratricopeptide (TPR) repeat protein
MALMALSSFFAVSALATDGYGHVAFANSGGPAAQRDFLDGLALLHDFEYESAAAAFRRAEAADPRFAMAYWGEAMTYNHPLWAQQDLKAARAALNKLAPSPAERRALAVTDREKAYLEAVEILYGEGTKEERDFHYEAAMADVHARYPQDIDATAFYGLAILGTAHSGRDVATYMRAAGILEEAWTDHREHPGLVHYLIHCYDDPDHAPLGLRAARIYARIAPDAGHAQHMTAHIFLALGMWPATLDANLAAIAAVNRARKADGKEPLACGHYPTWLAYAYQQLGKFDEAAQAVEACRASLDRLPPIAPPEDVDPDHSPTGAFASMQLHYLLDTQQWGGKVAGLSLPATAGPGARLDAAFAHTLGEIAQGHAAAARASFGGLESAAREVVAVQTKRGDPDPTYRVRPDVLLLEARGLMAELDKDTAGAEKLLRQAVTLEGTLPIAFGPPAIDKPTHELLGEFLLRHGRADEAREEFKRALALAPGRRLATQGLQAVRETTASVP